MKIRGLKLEKGETYLIRVPDYAAKDEVVSKNLTDMASKAQCVFLIAPRSMTWRKIKRGLLPVRT